MFENIMNIFKKINKKDKNASSNTSKDAAKERLHLVLMQDRANVSADFLELMKQEIIDVIKKYIDIDERAIDVRLTNKENEDGTNGAPALYANIPIINIKNETKKLEGKQTKQTNANTKREEVALKKEESQEIEIANKEEQEENEKPSKEEETIVENKQEKEEDKIEQEPSNKNEREAVENPQKIEEANSNEQNEKEEEQKAENLVNADKNEENNQTEEELKSKN